MMRTNYTKIFHTIPFPGVSKLQRNDKHKKVDQEGNIVTPSGKWAKHTTTHQTDNTPVLAAIAGEDFIGIDLDTTELFNIALGKAPHTAYIAKSLPETADRGGHLIFKYTPEAYAWLKPIRSELAKLNIDVQMDTRFLFLATPANSIKELLTEPITNLNDLTPVPAELILLLLSLAKTDNQQTSKLRFDPMTSYGYLLKGDFTPDLVHRLTPKKDFPNIENMDDIPRGSATNWLLQVRQKLQADPTVSPDVFALTINNLVKLWTTDRGPKKQLWDDIKRDTASINFIYNEDWETTGLTYVSAEKDTINVYFAHTEGQYITYNTNTDETNTFDTFSRLADSIKSSSIKKDKYSKDQVLDKALSVTLDNTPLLTPRLTKEVGKTAVFNYFTPSEAVQIIQSGTPLKDYKHPETILGFFNHLIPDKNNQMRFLQFLAHKHLTYDHSPLYFVFAGAAGAGKGLLNTVILAYLAGLDRIASDGLDGILNNFNSLLGSIDYLILDEAGEGYSKRESQQLVAMLKRITGDMNITIEAKGVDKKKIRHFITPILSTNMTTKLITSTSSDDRRMVLIKSPDKLNTETVPELVRNIKKELPSFAYYLTTIPKINIEDYTDNSNWKTEDYKAYMEETLSFSDRLFEATENRNLQEFIKVLQEAYVPKDDIDKLFEVSTHHQARALLYRTPGADSMDLLSFDEIVTNSQAIDTQVKTQYKSTKVTKGFSKNDRQAKIQVLVFDGTYTPFTVIEPTQDDGTEIDLM